MFDYGKFKSASGINLDWKIECDDLSDADIATVAHLISSKVEFYDVVGVPRGGIRLANALQPYRSQTTDRLLVVDDVWTTGHSMIEFIKKYKSKLIGKSVPYVEMKIRYTGFVIFNRGYVPLPPNIYSLFDLHHIFGIDNERKLELAAMKF